MSDEPNSLILAYADEYRSCLLTGQHDRRGAVAEQLMLLGWTIDDSTGRPVRVKERAVQPPAPERRAPQRRTQPKGE